MIKKAKPNIDNSGGQSTSFYYSRTYGETPFFWKNIYVFSHSYGILALDINTGSLLWEKPDTFDFPIPYDGKGYMLNLMNEFKVIDLETGIDIVVNENWVPQREIWYDLAQSGNNLHNQKSHIKVSDKYIVAYNYWIGIFYFFDRNTGNFLFEKDIKEQFWTFAIKQGKANKKDVEQARENLELNYTTTFWEIFEDRLYIQLPFAFCVFNLFEKEENTFTKAKIIGTESGLLVEEKKLKEMQNKKGKSENKDNDSEQLVLKF